MRYPFVIYLNKLPKQAASMPILFVILVDKIWKHSIYRNSTVAHELVHVKQWVSFTFFVITISIILSLAFDGRFPPTWVYGASAIWYYICYHLIHDYRLSVEIEATVAEVKQMEKDFEGKGVIELDIPGELKRQSGSMAESKIYKFKKTDKEIEKMLTEAYIE